MEGASKVKKLNIYFSESNVIKDNIIDSLSIIPKKTNLSYCTIRLVDCGLDYELFKRLLACFHNIGTNSIYTDEKYSKKVFSK